MKILLSICLLCMFLFADAQPSDYHPFPEDNAIWNIHYIKNCFSGGWGDEYYSIMIAGDTLIDIQVYQKLTTPYVLSYSTGTCGGLTAGYKGAIRQDTALRKVYFIPPADTTEYLLYDFNMQVGDTVKGYLDTNAYILNTVVSIDSVQVGNTYRKRWYIDPNYQVYLIEGIGSTYGLIESSPGSITDFPGYALTCFQQDGLTLYPDSFTNCQIITSTGTSTSTNQIKVYPNPSSGYIIVDFDNTDITELRISDLAGRIKYFSPIINQSTLRIDDLRSGAYLLTCIGSDNRVIRRKIICYP